MPIPITAIEKGFESLAKGGILASRAMKSAAKYGEAAASDIASGLAYTTPELRDQLSKTLGDKFYAASLKAAEENSVLPTAKLYDSFKQQAVNYARDIRDRGGSYDELVDWANKNEFVARPDLMQDESWYKAALGEQTGFGDINAHKGSMLDPFGNNVYALNPIDVNLSNDPNAIRKQLSEAAKDPLAFDTKTGEFTKAYREINPHIDPAAFKVQENIIRQASENLSEIQRNADPSIASRSFGGLATLFRPNRSLLRDVGVSKHIYTSDALTDATKARYARQATDFMDLEEQIAKLGPEVKLDFKRAFNNFNPKRAYEIARQAAGQGGERILDDVYKSLDEMGDLKHAMGQEFQMAKWYAPRIFKNRGEASIYFHNLKRTPEHPLTQEIEKNLNAVGKSLFYEVLPDGVTRVEKVGEKEFDDILRMADFSGGARGSSTTSARRLDAYDDVSLNQLQDPAHAFAAAVKDHAEDAGRQSLLGDFSGTTIHKDRYGKAGGGAAAEAIVSSIQSGLDKRGITLSNKRDLETNLQSLFESRFNQVQAEDTGLIRRFINIVATANPGNFIAQTGDLSASGFANNMKHVFDNLGQYLPTTRKGFVKSANESIKELHDIAKKGKLSGSEAAKVREYILDLVQAPLNSINEGSTAVNTAASRDFIVSALKARNAGKLNDIQKNLLYRLEATEGSQTLNRLMAYEDEIAKATDIRQLPLDIQGHIKNAAGLMQPSGRMGVSPWLGANNNSPIAAVFDLKKFMIHRADTVYTESVGNIAKGFKRRANAQMVLEKASASGDVEGMNWANQAMQRGNDEIAIGGKQLVRSLMIMGAAGAVTSTIASAVYGNPVTTGTAIAGGLTNTIGIPAYQLGASVDQPKRVLSSMVLPVSLGVAANAVSDISQGARAIYDPAYVPNVAPGSRTLGMVPWIGRPIASWALPSSAMMRERKEAGQAIGNNWRAGMNEKAKLWKANQKKKTEGAHTFESLTGGRTAFMAR